MSRSDLERLQDACDFARHAKNNASGLDADILADAIQPQHAALFDLVIIGEALNKVSTEIQKAAPNVPWRQIIDMRHIIVHAYWLIDLEIVADVIKSELDPSIEQLEELIAVVERTEP
jgi:uncharacterized protein with HEPN domain